MKRVLFAVTGTIAGLVGLLSFKSQSTPLTAAGGLPSLGGAASSSTAQAPSTPTPRSSSVAGAAPKRGTRAPAARSSATSTAPVTKSYTGQAVETQYGIVQIKVTVAGSKITNVSFVQLTAFDGRSQEINSQAAPILLQETMAAQSAHIDVVSGATYTSDGYLQSLQSALDEAGIK
jgi:uncharacterized protein with FMN-binding domain